MEKMINQHFAGSRTLLFTSLAFLALIVVVSGALFYWFTREITSLESAFAERTTTLGERVVYLEAALATTTLTSQELAMRLAEEQQKSNRFESTISTITGTVGTLEKLSKTDRELLQKYSKVYFLSDNYVPLSLATINSQYLYDNTKTLQFHTSALSYLERMINQAKSEGVTLKIVSAYRSFGTQSALKSSYLVNYGTGANAFSADQGYSEHQLGTALDLAGEKGNGGPLLTESFENTPEFAWLAKYAYRYGFILSYPKDNDFYQYEPWHWRFVGIELATKLYNEKITFADMEQRTIDTYLVKIFD